MVLSQSETLKGKTVFALTITGKIVLALLVAVLATTLWMAWHYQKSASMMETALEKILDSFKIERDQRERIEFKLNHLEQRVQSLEVKTPLNQPSK